jgi:Fe2+ or Zn2+ uptake regulation protein
MGARIAAMVRPEVGAVSLHAAYDALVAVGDKSIIRRIQPAWSPRRYEDRVEDNQDHFICRTFGRMVDVDFALGDTPCLTAAEDSGGEIDEAEVIHWGRCPDCVARLVARPADDRVPRPRNNLSETALDVMRRASANTDHQRNQIVST